MVRVLAVADSDSYLKWSAATLAQLPPDWSTELVLINSPLLPSPAQRTAAGVAGVEALSLLGFLQRVRRSNPDVIMLGCTGPVVELLAALPLVRAPHRTLLSGLPGMSIPASRRALHYRRGCDVFVVHSRRERREFTALAASAAPGLQVALARLPFLSTDPRRSRTGSSVVFAAQAKVPAEAEQRRQVLRALAELTPPARGVVKLRATAGERQTHDEAHPYPQLWQELVAAEGLAAGAVTFDQGAMVAALSGAAGLVTVSSTAALEAMALGIEVVLLSDFGISDALLNPVYADSGCLGTLSDVRAGRFRTPDPTWLRENYLHPREEDDLIAVLTEIAARWVREPVRRRITPSPRRLLRSALRLLVPNGRTTRS